MLLQELSLKYAAESKELSTNSTISELFFKKTYSYGKTFSFPNARLLLAAKSNKADVSHLFISCL